jgi:hypothetical protein
MKKRNIISVIALPLLIAGLLFAPANAQKEDKAKGVEAP